MEEMLEFPDILLEVTQILKSLNIALGHVNYGI